MVNSTKIILKTSGVEGKPPTTSDLDLGEIAINTYDGDLYLKRDQNGEMSIIRFTRDNPIENVIFVQKSGDDTNRGDSWDSAYLTIERAIEDAWTREDAIVLIELGPGIYTTKGHIDMPDNCIIKCVYRSVKIRPEPGYEERNVFRMGSGCFIEGPVFEGFRIDSFDNPSEGFAAVFRPGSIIRRTPYVHKIAVRSIPTWTQIAPPLDRTAGNPLVPRGGGVVMADGNVISPYSIYPNIMTWGATPVIHNGVGYVAKNGALINAVNAISMWAHKHFYAINGGQIVLSGCSTQFGDYTLIAEGVRNVVNPYSLSYDITANTSAGVEIYAAANTIINGMWANLVSEGYTSEWPQTYEDRTFTDANLLMRSLSWTIQSGNEKPVRDFAKGFFDIQGDRVFVPQEYDYDKCFRDTGLISEAIAYDVAFGSNYRSVNAAKSYYRANASEVVTTQLADTLSALTHQKAVVGSYLSGNSLVRSSDLFDEVIDIVTNGPASANAYILPDPTSYDVGFQDARRLLVANKEFIQQEIDAWIKYQIDNDIAPFARNLANSYDQATCSRDVGLIIDSLGYDMMFGSNNRAITAGRSYYRQGAAVVTQQQKAATVSSFTFLKQLLLDLVATVPAAVDSIEAGMDIIINILENGLSATPAFVTPIPSSGNTNSYDVGYLNARNNIESNRSFIKAETASYLEAKYPSIEYDRAKCLRDVDYILDAVFFDMTYGGNLETVIAGNSYFSGAALQFDERERAPTIDVYEYLSDLLASIAVNTVVVPYQDVTPQVLGVTAGSSTAASAAKGLITTVVETVRTSTAQPQILPDVSWVSTDLTGRFAALQSSKSTVQSDVIVYVNSIFQDFTYNRDLCKRDIGLIIDAVGYDLMFGTNFRTVTASRSYYRAGASVVTASQKAVTISAIERLQDIMLGIVSGISSTAVTRVTSNMATLLDTLETGISVLPTTIPEYTIPQPTGGTENSFISGYAAARDAIEVNRNSIKTSTIAYIEANYPAIANTYNQTACERDIDYILNATYYDLTYGGNLESAVAAKAYYSNATLQLGVGETAATIAAYEYMRDQVGSVATAASNTVIGIAAESLIQLIVDTVSTGNTDITIVEPNAVWVASDLVNSFNALQTQKETVKTDVIDYVDSEFAYGYDVAKCRRDIGLIIDALRYDMTYGGNLETYNAAASYFVGAVSQFGSGEKLATVAALGRMAAVLGYVLQAQTLPDVSLGNVAVQDTTAPAGSLVAATFAQTRVGEISSTVTSDGNLPLRILPSIQWADSEYQDAFTLINIHKADITVDVMEYISKQTKSLLGSFLNGYDYIDNAISNLPGIGVAEAAVVSDIIGNIKRTILDPVKVEEPSLISAIGHTWTAIMSGVALTKIPTALNQATIQDSILELNKGSVIASGQDDQGSALFVGGLEINADTGELAGPPFQQAVNRISTRAAISRSF